MTGRRYGLKSVSSRRGDALAQASWDSVEVLLADHYRREGYRVEHVGTGASGGRFDGGIDLKLYRDDAYIVVQCKHWNAYKVPHNEVHQLLGVMVNEGATGAILATSGEFTKAAIEAAGRQGRVHLIDGDDLRAMLGPLPALDAPATIEGSRTAATVGGRLAANVAERLVAAAEDRIRHGGSRSVSRAAGTLASGVLLAGVFKIALAAALLLIGLVWLPAYLRSVVTPVAKPRAAAAAVAAGTDGSVVAAAKVKSQPVRQPMPVAVHADAVMSDEEMRDGSAGTRSRCAYSKRQRPSTRVGLLGCPIFCDQSIKGN